MNAYSDKPTNRNTFRRHATMALKWSGPPQRGCFRFGRPVGRQAFGWGRNTTPTDMEVYPRLSLSADASPFVTALYPCDGLTDLLFVVAFLALQGAAPETRQTANALLGIWKAVHVAETDV
jgi:hypothetical protein